VQKELEKLRELTAEQGTLSVDTTHPRVVGSILHDFYTGVERIFQKIATELEGDVPKGAAWHKDLLDDMALEIREVRPAVISDSLREDFEEYLRFRHLFRGSYGFDLEPERMRSLFDQLESVLGEFEREMGIFLQTLSELAKGMESDALSEEE
jgi:hypothetical protein